MVARDHDPTIACKARQNGKSGIAIKKIVRIEVWNVRITNRVGWRFHIAVYTKYLAHGDFHVWQTTRSGAFRHRHICIYPFAEHTGVAWGDGRMVTNSFDFDKIRSRKQ